MPDSAKTSLPLMLGAGRDLVGLPAGGKGSRAARRTITKPLTTASFTLVFLATLGLTQNLTCDDELLPELKNGRNTLRYVANNRTETTSIHTQAVLTWLRPGDIAGISRL